MRPDSGEVLHFSEDPTISLFAPHVATTARQAEPYVWAVDADLAPAYWFPRQCPRTMGWADSGTTPDDAHRLLGPGTPRVHSIEYGWLPAMMSVSLYAYRLDASLFRPFGDAAYVCETAVRPLGRAEPVGNLLDAHDRAGIELRLVTDLKPWWDALITSTVHFSGVRLRNSKTLV